MSEPQSSTSARTIKIFISYAREDSELRDELIKHLGSMKQQGLIEDWNDCDISPGNDWKHVIDVQLHSSHIILLLISADFLRSEYSSGGEMKKAMKRHHSGEAHIIPIILRPVDWEGLIFGKLQPLPVGAKAVTLWQNRDDAFLNIARGIKKVVNELTTKFLVESPTSVDMQGIDLHKLPSIWNVPYRRNPFFTAREDILSDLHKFFGEQGSVEVHAQAISGLGGVGKSQVAIEYCYRHALDYNAILWVKADLYENITADFVQVANLLNLPERNVSDQHLVIAAVKRWLQNNERWLLVLDNVEDVAILDEFIPSTYRGHILITTRSHAMGGLARSVEIVQMQPQEGALLLLRRAKLIALNAGLQDITATDSESAQEISAQVDGLPLALDQAGAYIEETKTSLPDYLKIYRKRQTALLKRRGQFTSDHPLPVTATFQLALEKIEHTNTKTLNVLKLCAFLHPDTVAEEIFTDEDVELKPPLQAIVGDMFELNEAIEELLKFSLVRRNSETRVLSIHRLVQAVMKDQLNKEQQRQQAERVVRGISHLFPSADFENWALCKRYLPQALVCDEYIEQEKIKSKEAAQLLNYVGLYLVQHALYTEAETLLHHSLTIWEHVFGPDSLETARTLNDLGQLYRIWGKYEESESLSLSALKIREDILGREHSDTAESLNHLGLLYRLQGKYEQAESLYVQALAIREKVLGLEHPDTAESLNNLALLYADQGKYEQAEPLYMRALAIRERVLGLEHPDTARSLNNLALLHQLQGKYEQAEPFYERVLVFREQWFGLEHPDTARSLNNLALLHQLQGKYEQAEPLYTRALAIREKVLGIEHPETAQSLNNLAVLLGDQGKYNQAEPLSQRALTIREHILGPEHPDVLNSLNNLALLYKNQGKYREAEPLYRRALIIREKVLGSEHPNTTLSLNNLAQLYQMQGKYTEAESLLERALAVEERVLGAEHPGTARSMNNLAQCYRVQRKYGEAEPLYHHSLAIRERILGIEHPYTAQSLNNLALLYKDQSKYMEAESLLKRALAIREKMLGLEHPDTAQSLNDLGELKLAQKSYEEAESLLRKTLAIREKMLGPEHPDTAQSLNNLAELYSMRGKYVEAEPLYQRALAIYQRVLGVENPKVTEVLDDYATLLRTMNREDEVKIVLDSTLTTRYLLDKLEEDS